MKDLKDIKFYIGPMTQNIIDATIEVAEEENVNFGFCVTRRQIDNDGGYVGYNTCDFIDYVKNKTDKVLICRDHSGPSQGKEDLRAYADMTSLYADAKYNIDVIHIDPWKKFKNYNEGFRETLNSILYIYSLNSSVLFEVGTEEVIKPINEMILSHFLKDLKYEIGPIFDTNVKYAVIQSGTRLEGTKNTGKFNLSRLQDMVTVCKNFNILSKEHNGDYLTNEEIKIRFDNGLDAINIAPEFGVIETKVLLNHINNSIEFEQIWDICLTGGKWKKWVANSFDPLKNKRELIEICGHYHNKDIKRIINIDDNIIKNTIKDDLRAKLEIK